MIPIIWTILNATILPKGTSIPFGQQLLTPGKEYLQFLNTAAPFILSGATTTRITGILQIEPSFMIIHDNYLISRDTGQSAISITHLLDLLSVDFIYSPPNTSTEHPFFFFGEEGEENVQTFLLKNVCFTKTAYFWAPEINPIRTISCVLPPKTPEPRSFGNYIWVNQKTPTTQGFIIYTLIMYNESGVSFSGGRAIYNHQGQIRLYLPKPTHQLQTRS
ncbi:hypothetical protein KKG22_03530 [Patescibacteria group bacterium]|nr:hypothetical protein [Patescibacteria group bacterium]MBU1721221.1 hypothetical protein [Patescibacteria group bacterium]MBU1901071.1 hypothetical protein [Patescibacteria group bacterium]